MSRLPGGPRVVLTVTTNPVTGTGTSDSERKQRWAELFDQLDLNKDGRIDVRELRTGLAERGLTRSSVDQIVRAGDTNQDGVLDFEEFCQYLRTHERRLKLMFSTLDRNNDGL